MASRFVLQKEAQRNNDTNPGSFGFGSKPERTNTPPADNRPDRAALGAAAKVPGKNKLSKSHQAPAGVAPQSRYQSPPAAGRNAYQNFQNHQHQPAFQHPQMQPAQQPADIGDVFNDTVTTGFDQTKSDLVVESNIPYSQQPQQVAQQDYLQNQNDYEYGEGRDFDDDTMHGNLGVTPPEGQASPRQLHRKRSQDQLNPLQQDMARNHPIDNRFHNSQRPASHPSLQIRPGYEENASSQQAKSSKKRGRANEPLRDATNRPARHQQQPLEEEEEEDQTIYQDVRSLGNGNRAKGLFDEPNNFERANGVGSDSQFESPRRFPRSQGLGSSQQEEFEPPLPDYDDETLKGMKYSDLKKESWETHLKGHPDGFSEELVSSNVTLEDKMQMILTEKDDDIRASFFAGMPAEEWNEAGDHIMAKMTELMKKLKDARTRKRKLVEGFEAVYEAREKAVRGKSENFDARLKEMKNSGEDVLRGKV
jgi:hypothetical protein